MGLFSGLFGGSSSSASDEAKALLAEETRLAEEAQAEADALAVSEEEERVALKKRASTMQGGGRTGLMFGGNESGVA